MSTPFATLFKANNSTLNNDSNATSHTQTTQAHQAKTSTTNAKQQNCNNSKIN